MKPGGNGPILMLLARINRDMTSAAGIERCAYCRKYVPVIWIDIEPVGDAITSARVAICEQCLEIGIRPQYTHVPKNQ